MSYLFFRPRLFVAFVFCVVLLGTNLRAQNVGTLHGRVIDPSGAAVPKVTIELTGEATGATRTTATDADGSYLFSEISPGNYTISITQPGFKKFVNKNVQVQVSTPTTLDIRLELGSVNDQITVEVTSAPLINTADATTGNSFNERQVKELPFLARNVVNLLTLQPGVVFTGQSDTDTLALGTTIKMDIREGAVNGTRGNQSNVTVDGVDSNNWENQAAFSSAVPVTLDSVQEVRVITSNANTTDGTSSGAQVALVTKSGSNEFHGNVRWYYRTTGFTANSFFNNANGLERPKLLRNIGGGSLGGPVLKNRVFFFLDNEERRDSSGMTQGPLSVPTDTLKDGVLVYACSVPANCPGGMVQGLTTSHSVPAGSFGLGPADIKKIDPAGLGINSKMVTYMNLFPSGNVPTAGLDGGRSFTGFRFNAPTRYSSNIYIARIDFNLTRDGRHTIFWRGSLAGVSDDLTGPQFPGQGSASQLLNNSRGMAVQDQVQITPTLVNIFRWGFTRLGVTQSGIAGPAFTVRDFSSINNFAARATDLKAPVNEFKDSVNWNRAKHSFEFGGLFRLVKIANFNAANAYPQFAVNPGQCINTCSEAFTGVTSTLGDPKPASSQFFTEAYMMMTGSITGASSTLYSDPHTQKFLPPGTLPKRTTAEHDFEVYAQDAWRVRPALSLTVGLRYQYGTPPWEVNGLQVAPTTDLGAWFRQREINMNQGISSSASPLLSWDLAGRANGKPSWYNPDRKNFAPRVSIAWSPSFQRGLLNSIFGGAGKSAIRAGFGIYYDRIGEPITLDSDKFGSPGLSTFVQNGSSLETLAGAPRFSGSCSATGCTGLPNVSDFVALPTNAQLPFTPSSRFNNFGFFVDPHLKTPYAMKLTLGIQRELRKTMSVEVSYLGTLGRRLTAKADFAQYLNLKDPKSGQTLWQAENGIAAIVGPNYFSPAIDPKDINALSTIKSIPFFDNLMTGMPQLLATAAGNNAYGGLTPTQAYYSWQLQVARGGPSWSCGINDADLAPLRGLPSPWNSTLDPNGTGFVVFDRQFTSLGGWTNWANSNYHSLQVSLHKNVGTAIFTASYVLSKSIDNNSAAENADLGGLFGSLVGLMQNPFDPRSSRSVSDFDLRHNFNGNFLVRLPFGRGERLGSHAGVPLNALIGGWQVSGLVRVRSGFPLSIGNGFNWPTSWQRTAVGSLRQPVSTSVVKNGPGGVPNLFSDPQAVLMNAFAFTSPGSNGSRNAIRSPSYTSTDAGLYKTFVMPWSEKQRMQFRVTAFNVFNNVNFSPGAAFAPGNGIALDPTSPATFGQITQTAGPRGGAREMEFAVRYEF